MIDTHVHVVAGDPERYPLRRHDHPGHEWVDVAPDVRSLGASMAAALFLTGVLVGEGFVLGLFFEATTQFLAGEEAPTDGLTRGSSSRMVSVMLCG